VLNGVLLSIGLAYVLEPSGDTVTFLKMLEIGPPIVLGALFPDVDTAFGKHRKTLHNLPVLAFFVAYPHYFGNLGFVWAGILTHYVLDVVGSKRGIALFYPWDREFSLPVGVPTSSKWTGIATVVITILEVAAFAAVLYLAPQVLPGVDVAARSFGL